MSLPSESSQLPVAYPPQLATTEGSQGNQVPSKARDESIHLSTHAQTCCKKGCRLPAHSLQRCAAIFTFGCQKSIHVRCYKEIQDKYMLENLVGMDGIAQMVACTKLCHTKVANELKNNALTNQNKSNSRIQWEKDFFKLRRAIPRSDSRGMVVVVDCCVRVLFHRKK
jgi:hypothetical protein